MQAVVDKRLFASLNKIENPRARKVLKTSWIVIVACSLFGLSFYVRAAYEKWHTSPDISTSVRLIPSREIPFPALTFCTPAYPSQLDLDVNPFDYLLAAEGRGTAKRLTLEQQNFMTLAIHTCNSYFAELAMRKVCTNRTEGDVFRLLKAARFDDEISGCVFRKVEAPCGHFLRRSLTDFGFCLTFNMQDFGEIFSPSAHVSDFAEKAMENGEKSAWTLSAGYSSSDDHVFPARGSKRNSFAVIYGTHGYVWICNAIGRGLKVISHLPSEVPTAFHESHFVEVSYRKTLAVDAKLRKVSENLREYPLDVRRCYVEGEKKLKFFRSYTKALCEVECMANYTLLRCGCVKFSMPREKGTNVCDLDKVLCHREIEKKWPNVDGGDCQCLSSCTSIEYSFRTERNNFVRLPSRRGNKTEYTTFSAKFARHTVEEHTSYVAYTLQNFIADCGGLVGLFLGFSLLSLFEFFCDFLRLFKTLKRPASSDGEESNFFYRACWSLAVISLAAGFFFSVHQTYQKWHVSPDISVTVQHVPARNVPMPALTLCHPFFPLQLQFNDSATLESSIFGEISKNLTTTQRELMVLAVHTCFYDSARKVSDELRALSAQVDFFEMLRVAEFDTVYAKCEFQEKALENCEAYKYWSLTDHGLCHTFNAQSFRTIFRRNVLSSDFGTFLRQPSTSLHDGNAQDDLDWSLSSGYRSSREQVHPVRAQKFNKLSIHVFNDYRLKYCHKMGSAVRTFFHLPSEIPTSFHERKSVELGRNVDFRITVRVRNVSGEMHGYPPDKRGCYLASERQLFFFETYTKTLCEFECLTNYTLRKCGCVKFSMPRTETTRVCGLDAVECYTEIATLWPDVGADGVFTDASAECKCLRPCVDIEYTSSAAREILLYSDHQIYLTAESLGHTVEVLTSYIAYSAQNFVADCGGLVGLFLGLSLLSIFEHFCALLAFLIDRWTASVDLLPSEPQNGGFSFVKAARRAAWSLGVALSFAGLCFYVHEAFRKWQIAPDIATSIEMVAARSVPMPAITVCLPIYPEQFLPAIDPLVSVHFSLNRSHAPFSAAEQNYLALVMQLCSTKWEVLETRPLCANRTENDVLKLLRAATYQMAMSLCEFQTIVAECEKIVAPSLTDHGICQTFNLQNFDAIFDGKALSRDFDIYRNRRVTRFPLFGSELYATRVQDADLPQWTLEAGYASDSNEIFPIRAERINHIGIQFRSTVHHALLRYCTSMGTTIKLIVHLPNEVPTLLHRSYFFRLMENVRYKASAVVRRTSENLRGYAPEVRRCFFAGERKLRFFRSYTRVLCDFECMTEYTRRQCGCVKFTMPRDRHTRVCGLDEFECLYDAIQRWPGTEANSTCGCLDSCTNVDYSLEVDYEAFYGDKNHSFFKVEFGRQTIEERTSYVAYKLQNFVADSGGLIGLFLGFSLLSTFELVCKLSALCFRWRKRRKQQFRVGSSDDSKTRSGWT